MDRKKDLIKWQWPFFLTFFVINFTGLLAIAYFGKDELHIYFNKNFNSPFLDILFKYYTDLATNVVLGVSIIFIILRKSWKHLLTLGVPLLLASMVNRLIKRTLFVHGHRPTYYFEQRDVELHLIEGVKSQIPYTFPSGHSILAVILCFYWCMQIKNRAVQFLLCIMTGLVAVSRVYLSKHFVIDTIGGSAIGLFFAIMGYYLIWSSENYKLNQKIISFK